MQILGLLCSLPVRVSNNTKLRTAADPQTLVAEAAAAVETEVNDGLLQCMVTYHKTGQRQSALGYLSLVEELTASELLGVFSFALDIKPCASNGDALEAACSLCTCFSRLRIDRAFPNYWGLIKLRVDEVMLCVLAAAKGAGKKPSVFCDTHRLVLRLLMCKAKMDKITRNTGELSEVENELVEVVHWSKVGANVFACATQFVLGEVVTRAVSQAVATLMAKEKFAADDLAKAEQATFKNVMALPGMSLFTEKRMNKLNYRAEASPM